MSKTTAPGTPSWLREQNERSALAMLLENGMLTRNRIGELTGLSKPTASQIVSRLESIGLIEAAGEVSAGRGPNAVGYGVRVDRVLGVAVDIDEAVIRSTVVDAHASEHPVVETRVQADDAKRSAASDITTAIDEACSAAEMDRSQVQVVVIGVQGAIDPRTDELHFVAHLPGWPSAGIRKNLELQLGLEVHIENDVNLAAVAERSEGAGVGTASFALLWMGEGLGVAVDLAGKVHRGAAGGAGEIGYLPVPLDAARFDPDARELQDLLGGPAIVRLAERYGVAGSDSRTIFDSLVDHPARDLLLKEIAERVALGIVPVLAILDPELIVLGGPVGTLGGETLAEFVRAEIARTTPWHPRAARSTVPAYPVLRGAREVLVRQVRQRLFNELSSPS